MEDKINLLQMCYERRELAKFLKIVNLIRQTKEIDSSTASKQFHIQYGETLEQLQAAAYGTTFDSKTASHLNA